MKKAIGYIRVSTEEQSADDKYGIEVQKQAISDYANRNDFEIVCWLTDTISGAKDNRPELDKILYDGGYRTRKGKRFQPSTIRGILSNRPFYGGQVQIWRYGLCTGRTLPDSHIGGIEMKKMLSIMLAGVLMLAVSGCSTDSSVATVETSETSETSEQQVIYEDEYIKATYQGISNSIMSVSLENKSNEEITILPMDSSVDGVMKQFTSGVIATIQPGKTFNQGWNLGAIPNKEIEFSMSICGKDMSELVRTDSLKIEVK